jgi:hypothetical protein
MYFENQNFQKIFLINVDLLVQYSLQKNFLDRLDKFSTKKKAFEHQNFEMLKLMFIDFEEKFSHGRSYLDQHIY